MASEQLDLTKLLQAVCRLLNAFHFTAGSALIERAAANGDQLLANLKQELTQLPPLASIEMSGEMRCFVQALIESINATAAIDKRFVTRAVSKLYRGFEPFVRNDVQRNALIDVEDAKEDALGIEQRHRIAHKLRAEANECTRIREGGEDLQMTRELQAAPF